MTQWHVGDAAPDATLLSLASEPVALSALWQRNGLILTFLRHFG